MTSADESGQALPTRIVVMGVCGCGKSTLGRALAQRLGYRFVEGDTLHPAANIARMSAGIPLTDDERRPFLRAVAETLQQDAGAGTVVTCSALRRDYRAFLCEPDGNVSFVLPVVEEATLRVRLAHRRGHFMSADMLQSQLDTFEAPDAGEAVVAIDGSLPLEAQVAAAVAALQFAS